MNNALRRRVERIEKGFQVEARQIDRRITETALQSMSTEDLNVMRDFMEAREQDPAHPETPEVVAAFERYQRAILTFTPV